MMTKPDVAAVPTVWERIAALRVNDMDLLAPKMRDAVEGTLNALLGRSIEVPRMATTGATTLALDPRVFETFRVDALAAIYYEQGVSRARTADYSWHGYGLAVDVISREFEWFTGPAARKTWPGPESRRVASERWFGAIATAAEQHGLTAGFRWTSFPDPPHLQWGRCRVSPSNRARELRAQGGLGAVWREVGAA